MPVTSDHEVEADPVLPWGKQGDSQLTNVFQDLGLIFGASRIQVQWRIGPDDDDGTGPSHLVWWPATLVRQLEDTEDGEGRLACLIRYDADTTNGYDEPEEREVTFIGEHELWDLEEEEILVWRKEGDGWECESEAEQANGTEDGTVDILSLYREEERKMRLMGVDTDQDLQHMLEHLVPQERRRDVAACYRMGEEIFRDEFTKFLQNKAAGVVEESEMKEVIAKINARLLGGGNQG